MVHRGIVFLSLTALAIGVLGGCGGSTGGSNPELRFTDPNPVEPTAGGWRTWVLEDGAALRPPPPPKAFSAPTGVELRELRALASRRTPSILASIDSWNGGNARRWNEFHRDLIVRERPNPPRASRGLAYVSVAMHDAMVAAWDAKYFHRRARPSKHKFPPTVYGPEPRSPSYVSERAAIGAAAADVLKYLFPNRSADIDLKLAEAVNADLYSGIHFRSDVTAGEAIGHAVAQMVLDRARADNSDGPYTGTRVTGPGRWVPTPPGNVQNPLEPAWGGVRTWVLPNGQAIRPVAPPAFGTSEFDAQVTEVWQVYQNLTPERRQIAEFWADGPGTPTPPGHWNQIGVDLAVSKGVGEPRLARMLALLGVAQADAFVACWDCKYLYWCVRPITEIRGRFDPNWLSPITTPPFPSYPSGHSATSGAAATLLGYIFPEEAVELARQGVEAMNSRLFGGIHFSFDNLTGFNMGTVIGARTIAIAERDGSPPQR